MAKRTSARRVTRTPNTDGENVRIDAGKYDAVRRAILKAVPQNADGIAFKELPRSVKKHLPAGEIPGGGSLNWYVTVVKLDMEMRGELERVPGVRQQQIRRGALRPIMLTGRW